MVLNMILKYVFNEYQNFQFLSNFSSQYLGEPGSNPGNFKSARCLMSKLCL